MPMAMPGSASARRITRSGRFMRAEIIRESGPWKIGSGRIGALATIAAALSTIAAVFTGGCRRVVVLLAWAACGLIAAGCSRTAQVPASGTIRIALGDYRLAPDRLAARTGTLTFIASNDGRMTHNLTISSDGTTLAGTRPIPPGGSTTLTATLPPGTYRIASTILSDQDLGEFGTLTVTR